MVDPKIRYSVGLSTLRWGIPARMVWSRDVKLLYPEFSSHEKIFFIPCIYTGSPFFILRIRLSCHTLSNACASTKKIAEQYLFSILQYTRYLKDDCANLFDYTVCLSETKLMLRNLFVFQTSTVVRLRRRRMSLYAATDLILPTFRTHCNFWNLPRLGVINVESRWTCESCGWSWSPEVPSTHFSWQGHVLEGVGPFLQNENFISRTRIRHIVFSPDQ